MAGLPRSPLAPPRFPDLPAIAGIRVAAGAAAIRHTGRDDVMLVAIDPGSSIAGVLTRSTTRAAPVLDCERKLAAVQDGGGSDAAGAAFVVNSGNANAFTGRLGRCGRRRDLQRHGHGAGHASGTGFHRVHRRHRRAPAPRPDRRDAGRACGGAGARRAAGAAEAIRTTDTFPKGACAEATVGGKTVRLAGIAKGSGMIAPDMATMLAFVFTDAAVDQAALGTLVSRANAHSFNAITVDSDTSTSDTMLAAATGRAGNTPIADAAGADGAALGAALHAVMHDLALQIVRDGEGASKLVEIRATGAADAAMPTGRPGDRQFAPGQDRDRRRGSQLGTDRHGGRQVRCGRRPRPAEHPPLGTCWWPSADGWPRPIARRTARPT